MVAPRDPRCGLGRRWICPAEMAANMATAATATAMLVAMWTAKPGAGADARLTDGSQPVARVPTHSMTAAAFTCTPVASSAGLHLIRAAAARML
jgi:hypothetical protein